MEGVCRDTPCYIVTEKKAWPLEESCHDTINCIVTGGLRDVAVSCVAIKHSQGCDMAQGRG